MRPRAFCARSRLAQCGRRRCDARQLRRSAVALAVRRQATTRRRSRQLQIAGQLRTRIRLRPRRDRHRDGAVGARPDERSSLEFAQAGAIALADRRARPGSVARRSLPASSRALRRVRAASRDRGQARRPRRRRDDPDRGGRQRRVDALHGTVTVTLAAVELRRRSMRASSAVRPSRAAARSVAGRRGRRVRLAGRAGTALGTRRAARTGRAARSDPLRPGPQLGLSERLRVLFGGDRATPGPAPERDGSRVFQPERRLVV